VVPIGLVYSIYDSTEEAIQKMIEASQRMLKMNSQGELGGINPAVKKHFELQIKTLQNSPIEMQTSWKGFESKRKTKRRSLLLFLTELEPQLGAKLVEEWV
jgi:hypothetical protein